MSVKKLSYFVLPVCFIHLHGHKSLQLRKGKHNWQVEFFYQV